MSKHQHSNQLKKRFIYRFCPIIILIILACIIQTSIPCAKTKSLIHKIRLDDMMIKNTRTIKDHDHQMHPNGDKQQQMEANDFNTQESQINHDKLESSWSEYTIDLLRS